MRLATFNILNGRSPQDDRVDVDRFAKAVHSLDADVLALQEVDRNQPRSENADLTAVAAEAMGAEEHRFVAAISGSPGATWMAATGDEQPDAAAYGIALLSRYPASSWEVIRLPALRVPVPMRFRGRRRPEWVRDEPRVAVAATLDTPYGETLVVNTHLSFIRWWNGRQLHALAAGLEHAHAPQVLMGDLNMGPGRAATLTGMQPFATHLTFPADGPHEQLDHILFRAGKDSAVHAAREASPGAGSSRSGADDVGRGQLPTPISEAVELPLSDHRALVADFGPDRG